MTQFISGFSWPQQPILDFLASLLFAPFIYPMLLVFPAVAFIAVALVLSRQKHFKHSWHKYRRAFIVAITVYLVQFLLLHILIRGVVSGFLGG